ncbi:cache domain-containing sensor histidine kinase [Saccharibacillus kuerlensis]|uniref:histidine kinase n=1 Tax=Saccharibacillus kuerlensis TaxID=459527 RepID=A0ABQ2KVC4_9BACL|nr:sensor histidine kinase [Saccharibacillus kuerlensis]GGN92736.1 hypothetical protein GCM10010969_05580 [Saccharibacillus kuerlensis]
MFQQLRSAFLMSSLRRKLTAAALLCVLLPSILNLSIYNRLTEDAVKKQAIYNAEESLQLVNGSTTNLMKSMLNIANYIQMNVDLNAYFKQLSTGNTDFDAEDKYARFIKDSSVTRQLENFAVVGERCYVTVLLTSGEAYTNYPYWEYDPHRFEQEDWFDRLEELGGLESYWTGAVPTVFESEKKDSPYQISVVRALRQDNSVPYGYVIVTAMETQFSRILQRVNGQEELMILDKQGHIQAHRNTEKIGTEAVFVTSSLKSSSQIMPSEKGDYLVTGLPLSFAGWQLVSAQPYWSATVNISSIFHRMFLFQLVFFALFLGLLLYLLRHFTRPLVQLGKTASAVQLGRLNVRSEVRGDDEIGRLGYSFDGMLDRVEEMIQEVSRTQARKRKAELAMLQAQIHPHFLFNALNSIRMKTMRRGDMESAAMIGSLSNLLRATVGADRDLLPLHEEIQLVRDYVGLMNMRQKERAELLLSVDPEALLIPLPRFCLQPAIENALIHGLESGAGKITVEARLDRGILMLSVSDDGVGIDQGRLEWLRNRLRHGSGEEDGIGKDESEQKRSAENDTEAQLSLQSMESQYTDQFESFNQSERSGSFDGKLSTGTGRSGRGFSGIGLCNVRERMSLTFGPAFRMKVESRQGSGTEILMIIPRKEGEDDV